MPNTRANEDEDFCYLTTTGRSSGLPRQIEIWFALASGTLYMLAGGRERANWVQNIRKQPAVSVRIGSTHFSGTARVLAAGEEDQLARRLLLEKYKDDDDLDEWGKTSLAVAVDLQPAAN